MSIEAMKQALEALERSVHELRGITATQDMTEAITSLRQAIEHAEKQGPEPIDHLLAENARLWGLIYDLHKKIAPDTTQAGDGDCTDGERLCAELKAKEQKEPVAWGMQNDDGRIYDCITPEEHARLEGEYKVPLYTTPQPQREWVGLTDDDIGRCLDNGDGSMGKIISLIEAKLKEKNT